MHRSLAAPALTRATSTIKNRGSTHHVMVVSECGVNYSLNVGFGVTSVNKTSALFLIQAANFIFSSRKSQRHRLGLLLMEKPFVIRIILLSKPDCECFLSCSPGWGGWLSRLQLWNSALVQPHSRASVAKHPLRSSRVHTFERVTRHPCISIRLTLIRPVLLDLFNAVLSNTALL